MNAVPAKPYPAAPVLALPLYLEFSVVYSTLQCAFIRVVENYRLLGMALVLKLYRLS
jgi:hypothetical protein